MTWMICLWKLPLDKILHSNRKQINVHLHFLWKIKPLFFLKEASICTVHKRAPALSSVPNATTGAVGRDGPCQMKREIFGPAFAQIGGCALVPSLHLRNCRELQFNAGSALGLCDPTGSSAWACEHDSAQICL